MFAKRTLVVVCLGAALSSCGGSSRSVPEQSGILHGGRIQGVDFRTPTRSGTTDGGGRFTYLPGEDVTFSVGGVELGSAAGAPEISLFTIAGLTPPSTERMLRRALDVALRNGSPFGRAMNIDLLLIELDADGNVENGLDVRNRQATLSGIMLDFDLPFLEFERSLYRSVPDLTHNIPPWLPAAHLFGSVGIKVPVHAQTEVRDGTGLFETVDSYSYYADGSLQSNSLDIDGDGLPEFVVTYEYGAQSRMTKITQQSDVDFDQVPEVIAVTEREYGANGDVVASVDWQRFNGGEASTWRLAEVEYDRFGRSTRQVVEQDVGADGSNDTRQTFSAEYDARGNGIRAAWDDDEDADGVIDSRSVTASQYDSRGRPLLRTDEGDLEADGTVDSRETWTYEYGAAPGPTGLVLVSDEDADGAFEQRHVYAWTYDAAGNPITSAYHLESSSVAVPARSGGYVRAYDRDRRVTRDERTDDFSGNLTRQVDVITFDDLGNQLSREWEFDGNVDGIADSRGSEGSEYGQGGERLGGALNIDWDADGLTDSHSSSTVTSMLLEDGVLHLAQWYFMHREDSIYDAVAGQ